MAIFRAEQKDIGYDFRIIAKIIKEYDNIPIDPALSHVLIQKQQLTDLDQSISKLTRECC